MQLLEFVAGAAANRQLQQGLAGQDLQAAPHGAGMAVAASQPFVPQIGMGIQLHQHQIGQAFGHGCHRPGTDRVLSPQHQGLQPELEDGARRLLNRLQDRFGRTERDLHRSEIGDGQVLEIQPQLRAVGLQSTADLADCSGSEPGSRPERCGAVVGHAEQAHTAAVGIPSRPHVDRSVGVEQGVVERDTHGFSSRSMNAGMASKPPRCQRGLQM